MKLPEEILAWNAIPGVRKVLALTPDRQRHLNARRAESFFQENWREGIIKVSASDFCRGKNDRHWVADFDFFIRPGTLVKIMEGKYDNRTAGKMEGCAV